MSFETPSQKESRESLEDRMLLMRQQIQDAERTGDNEWIKDLEEEIADVERLLAETPEETQDDTEEEKVVELKPMSEKEMVAFVVEQAELGKSIPQAINRALIGVNDQARRVYLRNLLTRAIK